MSTVLQDFIDFFNLGAFLDTSSLTVGDFLGLVVVCMVALVFSCIGVRCIFEFIKIITDYNRFR